MIDGSKLPATPTGARRLMPYQVAYAKRSPLTVSVIAQHLDVTEEVVLKLRGQL